MIPVVTPIPKPEYFKENCEIPGAEWLAANPTKDCHAASNLWSPFRPALRDGFSKRCGYLAIKLHVGGVVDHYVSCSEDRTKAFDWTNYRYASEVINSKKLVLDKKKIRVLDPFSVKDGWFRVLLPSFELVVADGVDAGQRKIAQDTLEALGLGSSYEAIEARWSVYESHWNNGNIDLDGLRRDAPLIADAVEARMREGKPLPGPNDSPAALPGVTPRKRRYAPRKRKPKAH